jgi:hypothetical protein
MVDNFSPRARQVVFVARFKAGERGATAIEVDDFIDALILEDQGMLESIFSKLYEGEGTAVNSAPSHVSFFSSDTAQDLLSNFGRSLPRSQPVSGHRNTFVTLSGNCVQFSEVFANPPSASASRTVASLGGRFEGTVESRCQIVAGYRNNAEKVLLALSAGGA